MCYTQSASGMYKWFPGLHVHHVMLAGVCLNGSLADTSIADFVEQMNVNFLGAVAVTKGERCILSQHMHTCPVLSTPRPHDCDLHGRLPAGAGEGSEAGRQADRAERELLRRAHPAPRHVGLHSQQVCARRLQRGHQAGARRPGHPRRAGAPRCAGAVTTYFGLCRSTGLVCLVLLHWPCLACAARSARHWQWTNYSPSIFAGCGVCEGKRSCGLELHPALTRACFPQRSND